VNHALKSIEIIARLMKISPAKIARKTPKQTGEPKLKKA
jgi:hypothetical protein